MRYIKSILQVSGLLLILVFLSSCVDKQNKAEEKALDTTGDAAPAVAEVKKKKPSLPMQYQRPAYMIGDEIQVSEEEGADDAEIALKVGATIRSTAGPQPLWDILKRLAAMKDMNVSWESDVDQNLLVDVDISATDDFYRAIDNLLRQVDYFHEMEDSTIVVKYKETRQYQVGIPYVKQLFETGTGGNVLGGNDSAENIEGTIRLDSKGNEIDIWSNIEENINAILSVWTTEAVTAEIEATDLEAANGEGDADSEEGVEEVESTIAESTRRRSSNQNFYTLDKNIGLITITAPRPLLNKFDSYFDKLKTELYRQIAIEAKIIEVELSKESNLGINWSSVLKNFGLSGVVTFGDPSRGGQIYPYIFADGNDRVVFGDGSYTDRTYDPTRFISKITLGAKPFDVFLNALKEEGETKVLSNPKISVLNGQPALITVGRNVTYIDNIESDLDTDTGVITLDVETERILSGIGMALTATIIDNDEIIMNLVPVTSELQEPIEYRDVGTLGATVGLPIVNIREMATTVRVKNGEMLVIGGLIQDDKDDSGEFLPILGDIPLVKYLFGSETKRSSKRELIILLKPVLI